MSLEISEIQISIVTVFFGTLLTSLIPPVVKKLWSQRRENNVFNVSESNTSKTCMRHKKKCSSGESLVLQVLNFLVGGLLFGLSVLRLTPMTYRQFDYVYNTNNSLITEDNVILLNTDKESEKPKNSLPYVELIISGFFFVVYFLEQVIQAFTGWDGWHAKNEFVRLPAINTSNTTTDKRVKEDKTLEAMKECSEPSLVACHKKDFEEEITEIRDDNNVQQRHKPECPLSRSGNNTINRRLNLPCRPSNPSSIIIVLPNTESNEVSTAWLQIKSGLGVILSVSVHQLTNGVSIAVQSGNWCWVSLFVILCHSIITSFMMTLKLMKQTSDHYIVFLCQLIFSILMPFGIIITSLLKITSFNELLLIGLSSGATLHLAFMTLLQSERCTRMVGLVQYISMYSGFTIVLCLMLLISNN